MRTSNPGICLNAPVSAGRKRNQRGVEAIEFGLFTIMMMPALIWMFISGMNFLRFNKANDVARAAALMYLKNTDFTVLGSQEIIERLAQGLDLEVDDGAAAPNQVLTNSRGSGLIVLTQVQYVGSNTCASCANLNQYVYLQRIYMGNRSLQFNGVTQLSALGDPVTAILSSSSGLITSPLTDTRARVASSFANLWSPAVGDGQLVYVVECFFANSFGAGSFGGNGIYTRVFM